MYNIISSYLKEKGNLILKDGDIATNSVNATDNVIVLSGNKLGLIMLADYIVSIALSDTKGAHIHLDTNNFFDDSDFEIIIEKVE